MNKVASLKCQVSQLPNPHSTEVLTAFVSNFFGEKVSFNNCSVLCCSYLYFDFLIGESDDNLFIKFVNVTFIPVYFIVLFSTSLLCPYILRKPVVFDFIAFESFCMEIVIA